MVDVNPIDDAGEYALTFLLLTGLLAAILVPFVYAVQPNPFRYWHFMRDTWRVRVTQDGTARFRWMPHYFFAAGTSFFVGQAVLSTLHYPLLFTFGATIQQIGFLDAISGLVAAIIDVILRSGPWGRLSRSHAFLFAACLNCIGYTGIIGVLMPMLSDEWSWQQWSAMFVTQTLAGLNLTFQEYAVMRNDWNEDIVFEMSNQSSDTLVQKWTSEESGLKLAQLMVVCRYPATILANIIFGPYVNDQSSICNSYAILGILSAVQGLFLAYCWKAHAPRKRKNKCVQFEASAIAVEEAHSLKKTNTLGLSHQNLAPLIDMSPGGPYFRLALGISVYNAVLDVTRKGYVRLLNLCVLSTKIIANADLSLLLTITFAVSWVFFWLADTASSKVPDTFRRAFKWIKHDDFSLTGKMFVGIVSFSLMGLGHVFMGFAKSFYGLLVSAVFFGLGQASSTGLRTVMKDDMRTLLRSHQHQEAYRRRMMRMVNGVATMFSIGSSLLVASFGKHLHAASFFYACVALSGAFLAVMEATHARKAFKHKEESFRSAGVREVDEADEKVQALLGEQERIEERMMWGRLEEPAKPSWFQWLCLCRDTSSWKPRMGL